MQDFGWLEGIFGSVRCSTCGAAYDRTDVNVVGNRDDYWFLRCICHNCGTQGVGVVILKHFTLAQPSASSVEEALVNANCRCSNCGAIYFRSDLTMVGNRDDFWFLRSKCHTCGTQSVVVAKVSPPDTLSDPSEPKLTVDDVLTAHEILREYAGDMHGLFAKKKGP